MRQTYVVAYDISDPKRLRKVYKTMRGYGEHVQLSVFRCELTEMERLELRGKLGRSFITVRIKYYLWMWGRRMAGR